MNIAQVVYKCPHCHGDMKFFTHNIMYASYVCEICQADLLIPLRIPLNKIKIAGQEIILDNKSAFDVLKREYGNETNEF